MSYSFAYVNAGGNEFITMKDNLLTSEPMAGTCAKRITLTLFIMCASILPLDANCIEARAVMWHLASGPTVPSIRLHNSKPSNNSCYDGRKTA